MMAMPRWPADQEPGVAVAARVPGGHPVAAPAGDAAGGRVPQECSLQLWSVWAGRVLSQRLGSRVCGQSPRYRLTRKSYSGRQRERFFNAKNLFLKKLKAFFCQEFLLYRKFYTDL